jgi:F0F1-type ATP synthase membrane subunit b/b'
VKGTIESAAGESARRGLFRRSRRSDETEQAAGGSSTLDAVQTVDELARRMDELVAADRPIEDDPVRAEFDMQRAVIARANDIAASAAPTHTAPEAPVMQPTPAHDSETTHGEDDIEARLDAALQPVQVAVTEPVMDSVTFEPAAPAPVAVEPDPAPAPAQDAVLAPSIAPVAAATSPTPAAASMAIPSGGAAASIGIDVERMIRLIEDEAVGVQHRIELELRAAHARAEEIIDRAEGEAEHVREHGQAQARVLLGEVEEIISEAQQTGEQILTRANDEASTLRGNATSVLQQAQTEARAIVDTARREGEQVLSEQRRLATVRAQEAMREQDRLKDQIRRLEERRRQVLESLEPLISQLTQMMPAGQAAVPQQQNVVHLQRQQTNQG